MPFSQHRKFSGPSGCGWRQLNQLDVAPSSITHRGCRDERWNPAQTRISSTVKTPRAFRKGRSHGLGNEKEVPTKAGLARLSNRVDVHKAFRTLAARFSRVASKTTCQVTQVCKGASMPGAEIHVEEVECLGWTGTNIDLSWYPKLGTWYCSMQRYVLVADFVACCQVKPYHQRLQVECATSDLRNLDSLDLVTKIQTSRGSPFHGLEQRIIFSIWEILGVPLLDSRYGLEESSLRCKLLRLLQPPTKDT